MVVVVVVVGLSVNSEAFHFVRNLQLEILNDPVVQVQDNKNVPQQQMWKSQQKVFCRKCPFANK